MKAPKTTSLLVIAAALPALADNPLNSFKKSPSPLEWREASTSRGLAKKGASSRTHLLILTGPGFNEAGVTALGFKIASRAGNVLSLHGNERLVPELEKVKGVLYVKLPEKAEAKMDAARTAGKVNAVHAGTGLDRPYAGEGVLIGVIDGDFDISHPAFLDENGKTRFVGLWNQNAAASANNAYGYGAIYDHAQLKNNPDAGEGDGSHGTHVASIAAGSEVGRKYYGVAPGAMIAGVVYKGDGDAGGSLDNAIMDGIDYLCKLADSLEVPLAINMSLGHGVGPHDGTSLFDKYIDSKSGPGRIIMGSAGNERENLSHIEFNLAPGDTFATFVFPSDDMAGGKVGKSSGVNLWGEPGKHYEIELGILNKVDTTIVATVGPFSTRTSGKLQQETEIIDPVTHQKDTLMVEIETRSSSPLNTRPYIRIAFLTQNMDQRLALAINGAGTVHGFTNRQVPFTTGGFPGIMEGDANTSIGELGGTAKRIISVGAYNSKTAYTTWDGEFFQKQDAVHEEITGFSSRGPTLDGRIKPDITGPGSYLTAAINSKDPSQDDIVEWPNPANTTGRYAAYEGTSMSSPFVTGVVALLLERDPTLTPEKLKDLLRRTATKDGFTGSILPNNDWGYGKINAAQAMANLLPAGIKKSASRKSAPVFSFADNILRVIAPDLEGYTLSLYDMKGKKVLATKDWKKGVSLNGKVRSAGVYNAVLSAGPASPRWSRLVATP